MAPVAAEFVLIQKDIVKGKLTPILGNTEAPSEITLLPDELPPIPLKYKVLLPVFESDIVTGLVLTATVPLFP